MKLHKATRYLLVITFSLFIVSCSSPSGLTIINSKNQNIDEGLLKWEEIALVNGKFLATDGWIEIRNYVTPSSDARQHYTESHAWIRLDEGHIIESLTSISDPETGEEFQRFVINPEGMRGELIELRAAGLNALEYARPYSVNWFVRDISPTRQDLDFVSSLKTVIVDILVEDTILDSGVSALTFTVEYEHNSTGEKSALFPENYGFVGKIEKYIYDKQTGNRLEKQESYIKEGGQQTDISTITLTVNQLDNLPTETKEELKIAEEELNFYIELFSKD